MARRGRALHHHGRREVRLRRTDQRGREGAVHRAVLVSAGPGPQDPLQRIQGRALSPHRVRQRAVSQRQIGLEIGPRTNLHHPRASRRDRGLRRRGPICPRVLRRWRNHHRPSLRKVAVSQDRRPRKQHHPGVRGRITHRGVPPRPPSRREGRPDRPARPGADRQRKVGPDRKGAALASRRDAQPLPPGQYAAPGPSVHPFRDFRQEPGGPAHQSTTTSGTWSKSR